MRGLIRTAAAWYTVAGLAHVPVFAQLSQKIKDINISVTGANSWPAFGADLNGITIFNATDVNGPEVWRMGSFVYFVASDNTNSRQLYRTDGTAGGTQIVKYVQGLTDQSMLVVVANMLFFMAQDAAAGMELWKSDGAAAGAAM